MRSDPIDTIILAGAADCVLMSLLRGITYFEYQRRIGAEVVLPWLQTRIALEGLEVGDIGAHQGGMIQALRDHGNVTSAVGLELREDIVRSSPFEGDAHFRLEVGDLLALRDAAYAFDLILLHDVLEHIPRLSLALDCVATLLRPGGHVFISFPPYYSAFGGHQQLASGRSRSIPFVHLLPTEYFFRVARPADQEYMSADDSLADMSSVRQARLTLRKLERELAQAGFRRLYREAFVIRPEYEIRYRLKPRSARALVQVPVLREILVNGAFYLVRESRRVR